MLAELERAFMSLTPDHREVLTLIAIEGMSYEQAAEVLGVTMGTIKSRLYRARASLSERLDGSEPLSHEPSEIRGDAI